MDELEFLRGIEGEERQGEDLVAAAEHFVRLKQQVGQQQNQYPDLELEKKASVVDHAKSFGRGMLNPVLRTAGHGTLAVIGDTNGRRAFHVGSLTGGAGVVGGAYAVGKHHGHKEKDSALEKEACPSCYKMKTACICATKTAFDIQPSDRPDIPKGDFAQPHKEEAGHEGKYPIPDRQHARSALGFAKMHHDEGALAAVKEKIEQKYPDMLSKKAAATAALKNALINALHKVDPPLFATTAIGAAAGGLGTYLGSRPQKDSGKSKMEEEMAGRVASHDASPQRGILDKMHNADLHHAHGYAEAFRQHPGKAALVGTLGGAGGGYLLGRIGGAAIRHFKKG